MNLHEGILDALIDEGESIIQIEKYLKYLKFNVTREDLTSELASLLDQQQIMIEYPLDYKDIIDLNPLNIEEYWFGLTNIGRSEWTKFVKKST